MGTLSFGSENREIHFETITTQAYNILRSAILNNELKEGEIYSQDKVSELLQITRTPTREALLALQKEGYIQFLRGRGFQVVPFNEKDYEEVYEVRLIIEKAAAGLAAKRASEEQICQMEKNIAEQYQISQKENKKEIEKYLLLDEQLHKLILTASANKRLENMIQEMRNQLLRTGILILQFDQNGKSIYQEHLDIFKAIKNRDSEMAEQAMHNHLVMSQIRNKNSRSK